MKKFELRKYVTPEIIMGSEVHLLGSHYFAALNISKILIVTDQNIRKCSWFSSIIKSLELAKITYAIFDQITPNSPDTEVMNGVNLFYQHQCSGIFAIGGGSVMDSAKGIGIVVTNRKHICSFEGVDKITSPTPPLICIPTTAGTSSDVSQFAIIRDTERLIKIAIISKSLVPDLTLLDPVVTSSMDKQLIACTGMDALTHAIEAYVSTGNSMITDMRAINAIKLISENLVKAYENPENETFRFNMLIGSLEAGLAFSNASLGIVHAIAHSLGGYYNLAHGECNALLLPHSIAFNYSMAPQRYEHIASLLKIESNITSNKNNGNILRDKLINMNKKLGLDYSLSSIGVENNDLNLLSLNSLNDACIITNPRKANATDIKTILEESL